MNRTTIVTLIASAIMAVAARGQNLILNGSFEQPVVTSNTYQTATPTSWNWSGGTSGYIFNGNVPSGFNGYVADWPPPQDGQQFADIGPSSYGPLSQAFTITHQGDYVLNWFNNTGHSGGLTTSPYYVAITNGAVQTVVSNRFDAYNATNAWMGHSIRMTLNPGTYALQFCGLDVFGYIDALIDNVSLEQLPDDDLVATIHVSAVDICWLGRTNQTYQVQYQTNLSGTNWFDFGSPVLGTGTNCVTDGINGMEMRFYRVIRVP